jgi:acyl-CoA synthetase (AMP-forming)/AMP-acid ligase II
MRGLMQHDPLVVNRILERALTLFPRQEIVTWTRDGSSRVPKWWLPDEIVFVAELPKTSVGKLDKKLLRQRFRERRPPGA